MQAPELHPVSVPSGVWKPLAMDLIGPFPISTKENQYICGLKEYFSESIYCMRPQSLHFKTNKTF